MKAGIAPQLVVDQVKNTAAWPWEDPQAAAVTGALDRVEDATRAQKDGGGTADYLRHLLAAHFSTVATFVPTDVDARIRHHAWVAIESHEALAAACDVLDDVASCA